MEIAECIAESGQREMYVEGVKWTCKTIIFMLKFYYNAGILL